MELTKKDYERHLNENSPEQDSELWIIGGVLRMAAKWKREYGTAIRKHDPIGFNVGYNEWKLLNSKKWGH